MDGRQVDTESKIAELESVLAHGDAHALYDASGRAALALEFRGVDEMIGLAPVALEQIERMRNLTVAALERAAQLGHLQAGVDLANRIYFSRMSERATEAFEWAKRAESIPRALYLLGLFTYAGFGCEKDVTESLRYHRMAAEAGEADAMFELYVFYVKGVGVSVDKAAAVSWCRVRQKQVARGRWPTSVASMRPAMGSNRIRPWPCLGTIGLLPLAVVVPRPHSG